MGAPRITEEEYNTVKTLMKTGKFTQEQIADIIGRTASAISAMYSSDTFDEYLKKRIANSRKYNKHKRETPGNAPKQPVQTAEAQQPAPVQLPFYVMEQLRKTNELLTGISQKLAYIVEDLYGTGKKEN